MFIRVHTVTFNGIDIDVGTKIGRGSASAVSGKTGDESCHSVYSAGEIDR